jgi:hypothetical protein
MSCPNANILGVPGQGFHSTRFMGLALNDILGTIGLALLTTYFFNVPFWKSLLAWFVAGEVLHYVYGVNSAFLKNLGLDNQCVS